ncbi:MAG: hypothetical protein MK210_13635 [Dehalococcoidia bacterium]|jgi:hypothetical protein|nr:hypothetical protein [Dehalococcoidia bacterium]|tara:strand:- start:763 stop:1017 length:255 start_codon:yes stop_codon:yes gene_type:complete
MIFKFLGHRSVLFWQVVTIVAMISVACGQNDDISTASPPTPEYAGAGFTAGEQKLRIDWQWQLAEEPVSWRFGTSTPFRLSWQG